MLLLALAAAAAAAPLQVSVQLAAEGPPTTLVLRDDESPAHAAELFCIQHGCSQSTIDRLHALLRDRAMPPAARAPGGGPLVAGVTTCAAHHGTAARAVRETWGRVLAAEGNLVFVSEDADGLPDNPLPPVPCGATHAAQHLCCKTAHLLHHVLERYPHKDWFLKADDDTFVHLDRLEAFLAPLDPALPWYIGDPLFYDAAKGQGRDRPGPDGTATIEYASGGAGMVFSRAALALLSPLTDFMQTCRRYPFDDLVIGVLMAARNVSLTAAPGFHYARPGAYLAQLGPADRRPATPAITFHGAKKEVMHELHYFAGPAHSLLLPDTARIDAVPDALAQLYHKPVPLAPRSPPPPPATRGTAGPGFLVFQPLGQLNNQRIALIEASVVARALGRTLVVPELWFKADPSACDTASVACAAFAPADRYYDWRAAFGAGAVAWTRDELAAAAIDPYWHLPIRGRYNANGDYLDRRAGQTGIGQLAAAVPLPAEGWTVDALAEHLASPAPVVGFTSLYGKLQLADPATAELYADATARLRVAVPLCDRAELFAARAGILRPPAPMRSLAIHLRVGQDWVEHCRAVARAGGGGSGTAACLADLDKQAARVAAWIADQPAAEIQPVFVASNAPHAELQAAFAAHGVAIVLYTPSDGEDPNETALVEQMICTHADVFVGNAWSTFSRAIADYRGKGRRSLYFWDTATTSPPHRRHQS